MKARISEGKKAHYNFFKKKGRKKKEEPKKSKTKKYSLSRFTFHLNFDSTM